MAHAATPIGYLNMRLKFVACLYNYILAIINNPESWKFGTWTLLTSASRRMPHRAMP